VSDYRGYTQAQNKATQRYQKEKLAQLGVRVKKGEKEKYARCAARAGMSLARFVVVAMDEKIERDGLDTEE